MLRDEGRDTVYSERSHFSSGGFCPNFFAVYVKQSRIGPGGVDRMIKEKVRIRFKDGKKVRTYSYSIRAEDVVSEEKILGRKSSKGAIDFLHHHGVKIHAMLPSNVRRVVGI